MTKRGLDLGELSYALLWAAVIAVVVIAAAVGAGIAWLAI